MYNGTLAVQVTAAPPSSSNAVAARSCAPAEAVPIKMSRSLPLEPPVTMLPAG